MTKSIMLNNLKYIVNKIKRHIKEIVAYVVVFSIVCFVAGSFLILSTKAFFNLNRLTFKYGYEASIPLENPLPNKSTNFSFNVTKYPRKENDPSSIVGDYDYSYYLNSIGLLKNSRFIVGDAEYKKLSTLASWIISKYSKQISNENLVVYKITNSKGNYNSTYGFIVGMTQDEKQAIFLGTSTENDSHHYGFYLESTNTDHDDIINHNIAFNTHYYIGDFEKYSSSIEIRPCTFTYNDQNQNLLENIYVPELAYDSTIEYSLDKSEWSSISITAKDAGTYIIYYKTTETDEYANEEGSFDVTIKKAKQQYDYPIPLSSWDGDDLTKELIVTPPKVTFGNTKEDIIKYRLTKTAPWSSNIPTTYVIKQELIAPDANGEYTIYYRIEGNENFEEVEDEIKVSFSRKNQEVNAPTPNLNLVYNGGPQDLISKPPEIQDNEGVTNPTISYSINKNLGEQDPEWDVTLPQAEDAGTYYVYYKVEGNIVYNPFIGYIVVTISKDNQEVEAPEGKELTYNGEYQNLLSRYAEVIKGNKDEDNRILYSINRNNWQETPTGKNAGKYTVYYRSKANNNYNEFLGSIEVEIKKADQTIEVPLGVEDLTYDGESKKLLSSELKIVNGNEYGIRYRINGGEWNSNIPYATDAGEYTIDYKVLGSDNYNEYTPTGNSIKVEISDPRTSWGKSVDINGITHYIDDKGKTSVEVTDDDIIWLKEESYMTYAWYGLDNSSKVFEKGSRFWVKWIDKDTDKDEWNYYYERIDDKNKVISDDEKLWIFLVGVTAPDGTEYERNFKAKVPLLVQLGSDWDEDDLKAIFIADKTDDDENVDIANISYMNCPEGNAKFAKLILKHFSTYGIINKNGNTNKEGSYKENSESIDEESKENPVEDSSESDKTLEYKTYNGAPPSVSDANTKDDSVMCLSYCVSILSFLAMYKPKFW